MEDLINRYFWYPLKDAIRGMLIRIPKVGHFFEYKSEVETGYFAYSQATARITELEDALGKCLVAFQLTREYVGEDMLPSLPGWSWFDACENAERVLQGEP